MNRDLTCIICPRGCLLSVELDANGKAVKISGNSCPRGAKYAESECDNPQRTLTTTVRCSNGDVVPVRSENSISKKDLFSAMRTVNEAVAQLPVSVGDVIIEDFFGTRLIATANKGV